MASSLICTFASSGSSEEEGDIPVWDQDDATVAQFYPIEGLPEPDISRHGALLPAHQREQLHQLLRDHCTLFRAVPSRTTTAEHVIHTGSSPPIRQKPYRVPYAQWEVIQAELEKMLDAKVIRPSSSPWASPIVLVNKKDGGIRFCVDFRKLNSVAVFDAYPMPQVEELFETVRTATVITILDLSKGYWQIPLESTSCEKTAFTTPFGLFGFEVMPFGLHNAPATFQRMVNSVLRDCSQFAQSYIDDIVIFSQSWGQHLLHLERVFQLLSDANLSVQLHKCQFCQPYV